MGPNPSFPSVSSPPFIAPVRFDDPHAALAQVEAIYDQSIAYLRDVFLRFVDGEDVQ